jgi:hypothetical protein
MRNEERYHPQHNLNLISAVAFTATAIPFFLAGSNRHFETPFIASASRPGSKLTFTLIFSGTPELLTTMASVTSPSSLSFFACFV